MPEWRSGGSRRDPQRYGATTRARARCAERGRTRWCCGRRVPEPGLLGQTHRVRRGLRVLKTERLPPTTAGRLRASPWQPRAWGGRGRRVRLDDWIRRWPMGGAGAVLAGHSCSAQARLGSGQTSRRCDLDRLRPETEPGGGRWESRGDGARDNARLSGCRWLFHAYLPDALQRGAEALVGMRTCCCRRCWCAGGAALTRACPPSRRHRNAPASHESPEPRPRTAGGAARTRDAASGRVGHGWADPREWGAAVARSRDRPTPCGAGGAGARHGAFEAALVLDSATRSTAGRSAARLAFAPRWASRLWPSGWYTSAVGAVRTCCEHATDTPAAPDATGSWGRVFAGGSSKPPSPTHGGR